MKITANPCYDLNGRFARGLFWASLLAVIVSMLFMHWSFWVALVGALLYLPQHMIALPKLPGGAHDHNSLEFRAVAAAITWHGVLTLVSWTLLILHFVGII